MNTLQVVEYQNQRILTTQQIADAYETDTKTISYNFNYNKDRYTVGKHYFCLEGEVKNEFLNRREIPDGSHAKTLYLWTEKGALLHAKSLNTDKAWQMYEFLVDDYYRLKTNPLNIDMQQLDETITKLRTIKRLSSPARQHRLADPTLRETTPDMIVRIVRKLGSPSANELKDYIKRANTATIRAQCEQLVVTGVLHSYHTTRTTRYHL
jgi:hypothetical protein